jgi:hypothetical protein
MTVTISGAAGGGGGGGATMNYYEPLGVVHSQVAQNGTILVQPLQIPFNMEATQLNFGLINSNSSSAANSLTFSVGLYTYAGSTASLASSGTMTYAYNSTRGASSSYTNYSGTRIFTVGLGTWNITPGNYLLAFNVSSSTSLTAGTINYIINRSNFTWTNSPALGGNYTYHFGAGWRSATANSLPSSIHLTDLNYSGNQANRQPWFALAGTF